jgi:choline kinase
MRLILLAAGHGYALDGMVKCLLRNPASGKTFLEHMLEAFPDCTPTVVVGYRAVEIMQQYPEVDYIYNHDWAVTSNSYSLGLALTDEPCYVCSSDMLFSPALIHAVDSAPADVVVTARNENRALTAINCVLDGDRVVETYMGPLKNIAHPEATGIFKISNPLILREWKHACLKHGNLFVGQTLPLGLDTAPVCAFDKGSKQRIFEVNTPLDYQNLLLAARKGPLV